MTATSDPSLKSRLHELALYRQAHLQGDEKGEAQIFLDRVFRAFGHEGIKEAGATLEFRLKRNDDKGRSFADLMYKPICLIEMKKAGTDLKKHFRQAFDYWVRAVPDRPRYVILCNFDEFQIYDFNNQLDEPVDSVRLDSLASRWEALAFLLPTPSAPVFQNDLVAVTRDAAARVAHVFRSLHARGIDRRAAQSFVLQSVMAMFSEDIGLLPSHSFTKALADSNSGSQAYDLLFGLFREMDAKGVTPAGRFKGTPYFNGGLFAKVQPIELTDAELSLLRDAAVVNWAAVRPEIFGTLFEQSMEEGERHALGAHFTSQADIAKVVIPTIIEPFRTSISRAGSIPELEQLLTKLYNFRVLDPACGSGNFLYVAYRELRRLEHEIVETIASRRRSSDLAAQSLLTYISPEHFFGIDINPFAVEVAKVTLLLAKKLASDELGDSQDILPLDNLDHVIVAADALFTPWPKADAIIGNPPYLGRRKMIRELGADYCSRLVERYPRIGGVSDFVTYWFPLAHDALPVGGRAGFVATKTVKQGDSRRVSLDYIVDNDGVITEAVASQPWSGDAQVTVSIVNWVKGPSIGPRTLWLDNGNSRLEVPSISSALAAHIDLKAALPLATNTTRKAVFQGQTPGLTQGFELSSKERDVLLSKYPQEEVAIRPFLGGNELLKRLSADRWLIDIPQTDLGEASSQYPGLMGHLAQTVLPTRQAAADKQSAQNAEVLKRNPKAKVHRHHLAFLSTWWRLAYRREEMLEALAGMSRYIALTRTSSEKRGPIFSFVDGGINIGDTAIAFPFDDDYSLGVLQSSAHCSWFIARCTTLETRLTYTSGTVFDSFPWPQSPSATDYDRVSGLAAELNESRGRAILNGISLAPQYDPLRVPGKSRLRALHEHLDAAVLQAYGFDPQEDLLTQLATLNLTVSEIESSQGETTGPGPLRSSSVRSLWRFPAVASA